MATTIALSPPLAAAGSWSITPRLGVSAEFSTNPLLREFDGREEEHVAALIDLPLAYDADGVEFVFTPDSRLANSAGYSSLASNYLHVNSALRLSSDLSVTTLQAGVARDSSLYAIGGFADGVGVRRDTESAGADWLRSLTERTQLDLNASWTHLTYAQLANENYFTDYRYLSVAPTLSRTLTERDTLQLLGTVGHYQSLNGITASKSDSLQLGYVRQLSEIWTLTGSAGYSRSANSEKIYFGPFYLGSLDSNQGGTNYSFRISRLGERLNVSASASRALQPTGFAFLSRQDSVNLTLTYVRSERWDFGMSGIWERAENPVVGLGGSALNDRIATTRYVSAQLSANWHWTEQWVLSLRALRITDHYGPPPVNAASTGINLDLSRQFLRTEL
jgi:hypothetical protein